MDIFVKLNWSHQNSFVKGFILYPNGVRAMLYVLFSVLCSVTVAVIIKFAKQQRINYLQLIVWNYPIALLLTYTVLKPTLLPWDSSLAWHLYIPLGLLLPSIFFCIALAIRYSGIVKTEVAQRLSLFIPLLAAYFFLGEQIGANKLIGIVVGLLAIICSIGWTRTSQIESSYKMIYPLAVFFGMGIIDVLFKQVATLSSISYMSSLWIVFTLAFIFALGLLMYLLLVKKQKLDTRAILYGALLGVFNFWNIAFYMQAHQALPDSPSLVFTGMNIGVITVGALVGVLIFKEKLNILNKIGIILAVVAVLLIALL
ncbi:EamA family transporter [Sphingobacterium sp. HJSM2_6]|uniref:EamA family transporter n=1 Tax=Sphingobacterium sp. HJSM2_6 TaxID=3366264 RepID=UPI003BCE7C1F